MKKVFYSLILLMFLSCKNDGDIKLQKFSPVMSTKLDLKNIDSIVLVNYFNNRVKDSLKVSFRYKFEMDSSYSKTYELQNWQFQIKDSFEQKHDYKLIFKIKNKYHDYYLRDIDYDTIRNGGNIYKTTKSYILNNKKFDQRKSNYFLDSPDGKEMSSER